MMTHQSTMLSSLDAGNCYRLVGQRVVGATSHHDDDDDDDDGGDGGGEGHNGNSGGLRPGSRDDRKSTGVSGGSATETEFLG